MARCSASHGRRRHSRWPSRSTSEDYSPGKSGRKYSAKKSKKAQAAGDPDTGETYYRHWLATLERILAEKGVADPAMVTRTRHAWQRACARTPHGMPIALQPDDFHD